MRIVRPDTDRLWDAYIACRHRNLYLPYGLPESCSTSELDSPRERADVIHRAALDDVGSVIGVGRLDHQPGHERGPAAQLRYFAVESSCRAGGVGRALLVRLEEDARAWGCVHLWMEARDDAVGFYTRMGYEAYGVGPTKWGVIPHTLMARSLV